MGHPVDELFSRVRTARRGAYAIGAVVLAELVLLPWTAHSFDTTAFFLHADRIFFAHVSPVRWWAFGSIALLCLVGAQLPVLFAPQLAGAVPLRIALSKLPSWISDLGTAAIIRACSVDAVYGNWWALRYLLDPAVLFTTVFHGQMDAIPNLFAVAGIALMLGDRFELSAVALGAGAGTKFFPAAYVPLLLVVAFRRGSARRGAGVLIAFAVTTAVLLAPVMFGRVGTVADFFSTNSYGPGGNTVLLTSLWALLPNGTLRPQLEQAIAVATPMVLAAALFRGAVDARTIARTALWSAMSIVLLNPGAHAPFYLWIAGPLVLYAAVANDGLVSIAGIALSCLGPLLQFCQEGSDEYFLLNFGAAHKADLLRCVAPPATLEWIVLALALVVVAASLRRAASASAETALRGFSSGLCAAFFCLFLAIAGQAIAVRASRLGSGPRPYWKVVHMANTFAIGPRVRRLDGGCELTFDEGDFPVFAGNPYAARYVKAYLGYELFSPETMTIAGREIDVGTLPASYEHVDLVRVDGYPIRTSREFEITGLLRPYRLAERFFERPCTLIEGNPVLYYQLDLDAAREDALRLPFLQRLDIFDSQEPSPTTSIKGRNHV